MQRFFQVPEAPTVHPIVHPALKAVTAGEAAGAQQ